MKLNLYHLDVDFIKNHSCLKDSWRHEARQYPEEIRAFIKDNQEKSCSRGRTNVYLFAKS